MQNQVTDFWSEYDRRITWEDSTLHGYFEEQRHSYMGYDGRYYDFGGSSQPPAQQSLVDQEPPPQKQYPHVQDYTSGNVFGNWDPWTMNA